jgi:hypothetical protein
MRKPGIRLIKRPAADVEALTVVALRRGATLDQAAAPQIASWHIHGDCKTPVHVWQDGYGHWMGVAASAVPSSGQAIYPTGELAKWVSSRTLQISAPCRKCPSCLKAKQAMWADRAVAEWKASNRTWFGTLTISPESRFALLTETRARLDKRGVDLGTLSAEEQFREKSKEIFAEATLYLKRLRKGSVRQSHATLAFRYLLVIEPHESREPHLHILVHEVSALQPVRKERLKEHWALGFTKWKLVESDHQCRYVAKYLGKYNVSRTRASKHYGSISREESVTEIIHNLLCKQQVIKSTEYVNEMKQISTQNNLIIQNENIDPSKLA